MKKHDLKRFVSVLVEKIDNNRDEKVIGNADLGKSLNGEKENGFH